MMGTLHALAELEGPAIIGWDKLEMHVGQSDRDAAAALLDFVDKYLEDGVTTYGDAEGILLGNFITILAEVAQTGQKWSEVLQDRKVRAALDCLWWFRFLQASYLAEESREAE